MAGWMEEEQKAKRLCGREKMYERECTFLQRSSGGEVTLLTFKQQNEMNKYAMKAPRDKERDTGTGSRNEKHN